MSDPGLPPPSGGGHTGSAHPPVGARAPGLDELSDDGEWDDVWNDDHEPNFWMRRAAVAGIVVAVIAVAAVVVLRFIDGDDDTGATAVSQDWNTIVVVTDDEIRLFDPEAADEEQDDDGEFASALIGDPIVSPPDVLDSDLLLVDGSLLALGDGGRLSMVDLREGTIVTERVGDGSTLRASGTAPGVAVIGPAQGGEATVVVVESGSVVALGEAAGLADPLVFAETVLVNRAATYAALSDARTFQSAVVDLETGSGVLLAGQTVAIDDSQVVSAVRAGDRTTLQFHDLDGERTGSADLPTPVDVITTGDGSILAVDDDGSIRRASADGDVDDVGTVSTEEAGTMTVTGVATVLGGDGHVAIGDGRLGFLTTDGATVAVIDGELAAPVDIRNRCVVTGSIATFGPVASWDVETGERVGSAESSRLVATTADGCGMLIESSGVPTYVAPNGESFRLARGRVVGLAPDGTTYAELDGRTISLLDVVSGNGFTVSDGDAARIFFAEL